MTAADLFVPSIDGVFVTGGSGFVGSRLLQRLNDAGIEVRALARSDASAAAVSEFGAEPNRGDLADVEALARGMSRCDVVVHAAAKVEQ